MPCGPQEEEVSEAGQAAATEAGRAAEKRLQVRKTKEMMQPCLICRYLFGTAVSGGFYRFAPIDAALFLRVRCRSTKD